MEGNIVEVAGMVAVFNLNPWTAQEMLEEFFIVTET